MDKQFPTTLSRFATALTFSPNQTHSKWKTHKRTNAQTHKRAKALGALGIAAMTTLLWTACQKEMLPEPGATSQVQENLTPRIADFVARAQHQASVQGGSRSTNEFSADSAAWYVEGALNYGLAQAWLPYNELVNDSLTVAVASANGTVNEADAANAFVSVLAQLNQSIAADQHLVVVDAEPVTGANGLELKISYALGQGNERLALNTSYPPNTNLLFYTLGNGQNSCCWGGFSAKGADLTIQDRVSATIPLLAVGQYYASVESWTVSRGSTNTQAHFYSLTNFPDPNGLYKIFFDNTNVIPVPCLGATDMAKYTQGAYDVMQWINQNQCPTKTPASLQVLGDFVTQLHLEWHEVKYRYGIRQYGMIP
ncbi:MAG: hypothetical protein JST45_00490 [Bacteroidetes bacterium]|nr:hypothetical protein [Bacteroidota bacterium]